MVSDPSELAELGANVVRNGQLVDIRDQFGLSSTMLAHMIGVAPARLLAWLNDEGNPSRASCLKIANWYQDATSKITEVDVGSGDLVHVSVASQQLGASYTTILDWCGKGLLRCKDLGVLGHYVYQEDVTGPSTLERG